MLAVGLIMIAFGVAGVVTALIDRRAVWWNTTRAEFVFRGAGLILVGIVVTLASFNGKFS
jgi:hypothetical protein